MAQCRLTQAITLDHGGVLPAGTAIDVEGDLDRGYCGSLVMHHDPRNRVHFTLDWGEFEPLSQGGLDEDDHQY